MTKLQNTQLSHNSLVSTVSDYGLDDGVRSLAGAWDFSSSLCIQTSFDAHLASSPVGTEGKGQPEYVADHPHLVPKLRMSRSYTSPP
jgi:hypothetical protein